MSKYVNELMGDGDLDDILEDDELGNIFKSIGKGLGKIAKVAAPIAASFIPGGSAALSIGTTAAGMIGKAAKGGKKPKSGKKFSVKGIATKAKKAGKEAVAKSKSETPPEVRKMALAAPVPMPVPANTIVPALDLRVQPLTTRQLDAMYGPKFKKIEDQLKFFQLQNQATAEHNQIKRDTEYKRALISKLNRFAAKRA